MTFDLYIFCMALGFFGLFAMLALGFGHGGHGGHLHDHGGGAAHPGASHGGHAASHHAGANHGGWGRETLLMLLAPRVWFSWLFGFGAIGCLLQRWMSGPLLIAAALVAAYFFERWMVQPVWNFVLRFASAPARTLESAMLEDAVAETNFDAQGTGLISVTLDGQVRQMLGLLQKGAEPAGRVYAGDRLIIVGVDAHRNQCTVAKKAPRPG